MLKNRIMRWVFCLLGATCIVALAVFAPAGDTNAPGEPMRVVFSRPSGFYDDAFYLEMDADGNEIYYTLDSSDPTENSTRYMGPILIQDASPNENVYSAVTDVTPYMKTDILKQIGQPEDHRYQVPKQPVDKATVVRAVSVDPSGRCSKVTEAVFFVGFGAKTGYDGINIMTVTTDPDNLFGYENGIYVMGKTFVDAIAEDEEDLASIDLLRWQANYKQKGIQWERKAAIHCFDTDRNTIFSGDYGIRIQGNTSRSRLPKNLNIYAREAYGPSQIDTGNLFDKSYMLKKLNLGKGSEGLMINDWLIYMLSQDKALNVTSCEIAPCALFLDGEYWGVYWLAPRFKSDYLNRKYGVDPNSVVVIKQGRIEVGTADDMVLYQEMLEYICNNDMSQPEFYQRACEMIDIQSFIEYYAVEIYISNTDWNPNNIALWRTKYSSSSPWSDGKWRWILFDVDLSMRPRHSAVDSLNTVMAVDPLIVSLMRNEAFASAFRSKLMELANETFEPEKMDALVEEYKALMAGPIEKKYERFNGDRKSIENFYSDCDARKRFFRERQEYVLNTYVGGQVNELS